MKFRYNVDISLTKFRLLFHSVSFIINTLFQSLHEMLYSGCIKLFAEALDLPPPKA
jgi:hypothetical protein